MLPLGCVIAAAAELAPPARCPMPVIAAPAEPVGASGPPDARDHRRGRAQVGAGAPPDARDRRRGRVRPTRELPELGVLDQIGAGAPPDARDRRRGRARPTRALPELKVLDEIGAAPHPMPAIADVMPLAADQSPKVASMGIDRPTA